MMTDDELRAWIARRIEQTQNSKRRIVRTRTVVFKPSELTSEWKAKALSDLATYANKTLWAEVYIRCGRCKREWNAWIAENPVSEPLSEWVAKAAAVIAEKRWI